MPARMLSSSWQGEEERLFSSSSSATRSSTAAWAAGRRVRSTISGAAAPAIWTDSSRAITTAASSARVRKSPFRQPSQANSRKIAAMIPSIITDVCKKGQLLSMGTVEKVYILFFFKEKNQKKTCAKLCFAYVLRCGG